MNDKIIKVTCNMCGISYEVACNKKDYSTWKDGDGFIQDLMPYLTADQRELLISGTCGNCFDKMFSSEDLDSDLEGDESEENETEGVSDDDDQDDMDKEDEEDDEDDDYARMGERIFLATDRCSSQYLYDEEDDLYDEHNPLDLTSREQNIMAEICSILSSFIMDEDDDYARMGERIFLATDRCSSQFFGRLYDKFHRTGSNS